MSRPNFDRLAPPPRSLPAALRIHALFGGPLALAGWILVAFSSPFLWAFALKADLLSLVLFRADADRVTGRVTSTRATGASEGRAPIHAVDYAYRAANGSELQGLSYVSGSPPAVGAPVTVGLRSGLRRLRLLSSGQVGAAEFVSQEPTSMTTAGTDGSRHRVSQTTTTPEALGDERREAVLFHPDEPGHAVLVDDLPEVVVADEQGHLAARGRAGLLLLLPLLTVAGNAACAAWRLLPR